MTILRRLPATALVALAVLVLASAVTPAAAQTAADIAAVQSWLNAQGYDAGPADGMMGARTRNAISEWEIEHGQPVTGELSGWIIDMAVSGADGAAGAGQGAEDSSGGIADPGAGSDPDSAIARLEGDIMAFSGTGSLEFNEREDGAILITDGLPWRPDFELAPRTLTIVDTGYSIFSTAPDSLVPVPLDNDVVDVPGSVFVPLFLAQDRQAAARSSLADAAGITWRFEHGGQRFELDGYVLAAPEAGATIAFRGDGVLLTGFTLSPQ